MIIFRYLVFLVMHLLKNFVIFTLSFFQGTRTEYGWVLVTSRPKVSSSPSLTLEVFAMPIGWPDILTI